MSDSVKITLPKLGESIVSATVVQWFKKEGDFIALDEPLLEVSTDKVNSEIPSPVAGRIQKILASPEQELQVGDTLALIVTDQECSISSPISQPEVIVAGEKMGREDVLSPSVMKLLKEKGIPLGEIDKIPHTGEGGRLTKKDVESYQPTKGPCPLGLERVKMSPMRKAIAENMVKSFYEAPHASLITEVDVTRVLKVIQENKQS